MQDLTEIKKKLLNSDGVKSLIIESTVFNLFRKLDWYSEQSPYFVDSNTKKLRELDIKARKHFTSDGFSCDVDILVECKSLNNYHVIANNESSPKGEFDIIWIGNYIDNEHNKLDEILLKYNFTTEEIVYIKEKIHKYCVPEYSYRWIDYKLTPFEIQTFNTYRETNVNTTKEIDNSVVWKCILSLQSAIEAHEELLLANVEFEILENVHQELPRIKKIESIINGIISRSNHVYFIHPIIVVESNLWEFDQNQNLTELKYFRLNIQKFFVDGFWVDIVNFNHLDEYLSKIKKYTDFYTKKGLKNH